MKEEEHVVMVSYRVPVDIVERLRKAAYLLRLTQTEILVEGLERELRRLSSQMRKAKERVA